MYIPANPSGKQEVAEEDDGGPSGDKVGDGLHDVPIVLPPHQIGQKPKLDGHP